MSSWLFRAKCVCTHTLHVILGPPVIRSVLTADYFDIAKYPVQFIDVHRVRYPDIFNLYFHIRGVFVKITSNVRIKTWLTMFNLFSWRRKWFGELTSENVVIFESIIILVCNHTTKQGILHTHDAHHKTG